MTEAEARVLFRNRGQEYPEAKRKRRKPLADPDEHEDGSVLERTVLHYLHLLAPHLQWEREYHFDVERGWRFDFALPEVRVAVEAEGKGHQKNNRYTGDIEKYNAAAAAGWCVLRCTSATMKDDPTEFIQQVIDAVTERVLHEIGA